MKKCLLLALSVLMLLTCTLPLSGCKDEKPEDPIVDPPKDVDVTDTPTLAATLSEREVEIVEGKAIHENTFGRIPQGLAEVVNQYMTQAEAMQIAGDTTAFQTVQEYSIRQEFGTDAVFVHCATQDVVERVIGSWDMHGDNYNIYMMTIMNRAELDDFEAWNAEQDYDEPVSDDIMTLADGRYKGKTDGNTYYMIPTERFTEYVWDMVSTAMDNADLAGIVFEEPDLYRGTGYAPAFKRAWEKYYDEEWQAASSSPEAMLKSNQLLVTMMNDMMREITSRIREKNPELKIYLASHSTLSYNSPGNEIVAGLNHYFQSDIYDGLIGQTWTNTANTRLTENGQTVQNPFAASYLGYASYVDAVGELPLYTVADAVGDGIGKNTTEADFYRLYYATIVSQLMQPEVNRFNLLTWPERSFDAVTENYRIAQLSVIAAQTEAVGKAVTLSAGTPGITYLLSDTLSWQNGESKYGLSTHDAITGVTLPLVSDGIPLKIKSMEMIKTADDLKNVNLLLLSFDCQKPLSSDTVQAVADWITAGGVCLYLGGRDSYDTIQNIWWEEYGSPFEALLDMLELDVYVDEAETDDVTLELLDGGRNSALEALELTKTHYNFTATFKGNIHPFLMLGEKAVGVNESVGKGRLIAVGLPSALYAQSVNGSKAMRALAAYACQYTDYEYDSTTLMWAKRGNVVAAHSIGAKNVLTGKYINLFDPMMTVHTHYVMDADESALLYDVSEVDVSVPRLAFSAGTVTSLSENEHETSVALTSCGGATVAMRFMCADGVYPEKISVVKGRVEREYESAWNNESNSLLLHLMGDVKGVTITVTWGTTPIEDSVILTEDEKLGYEPLNPDVKALYGDMEQLSVLTNKANENADAPFVWRNTSTTAADLKFCDYDSELIYRFNLKAYPDAVVALEIMQNYLVQVSTDGENWKTIQNYIEVNGVAIKDSRNAAVLAVDSTKYAAGADAMYVRLANANPSAGWGGAIKGFTVYYEKVDTPETAVEDYETTNFDIRPYASYKQYSVTLSGNGKADQAFVYFDTAAPDANGKVCDRQNQVVYRFDLTEYPDAVVVLDVSQNYHIQVSNDGVSWRTVQNYEKDTGTRAGYLQGRARIGVLAQKYAPDADALYIRIAASDVSQGFGAVVFGFTVYYR